MADQAAAAPQARAQGMEKPWLGVGLAAGKAHTPDLEETPGVQVSFVYERSPAEAGGLLPGDIIVKLDGQTAQDAREFLALLGSRRPGTEVKFSVLRDGKEMHIPVVLGRQPEGFDENTAPAKYIEPEEARKARIVPQTGATEIRALALSSDGRFLLTASGYTVKLWEVATRKEVRTFAGHTDTVDAVAFSPDGRLILSGGGLETTVKLWETATGKEVGSLPDMGRIEALAFSPDGRRILIASGKGVITVWDLTADKMVHKFASDRRLDALALSRDGRLAVTGGREKVVRLWNVETGKELRSFRGHSEFIKSVALSPDGRLIASCDRDGALKLWDVNSGSARSIVWASATDKAAGPFKFPSAVFLPDGRSLLAINGQHSPRVWDVTTGKELRRFAGKATGIERIAVSADGRFAVTAASGSSGALKFWDVATGEELPGFSGHGDLLQSVSFSPDGRFALTGGGDKTLKLWEMATGKALRVFRGHTGMVTSAVLSGDGRLALSGGWDGVMKLWDTATGKELRSFSEPADYLASLEPRKGDAGLEDVLGVSRDKLISDVLTQSGDMDAALKLPEAPSGQPETNYVVKAAALSPDGRFALSGGCGWLAGECIRGAVNLWDATTGKKLRVLHGIGGGVHAAAFSPDGRFALAAGCEKPGKFCGAGVLKMWDVAAGKELRSFTGHKGAVLSAVFSPDGRFILSGGLDSRLRLWDAATGKMLRSFSGPVRAINAVAFSRDGRMALSGDEDKAVKLWDLATGKELRGFSGHTNGVRSVALSPDGRFALSGSWDGSIRLWRVNDGRELAGMLAAPDGEWLTITPEGFFSASHRDTDLLAIVRGNKSTSVGQVHQSLFNPDLVRQALAGDPGGEVGSAAKAINLGKVLDAGPPPKVAIAFHGRHSQSGADFVPVTARVTDGGRGVGRVEWRINGVTAAVIGAPANTGSEYEVERTLALDPGENQIEVIAYEGRNLLASPPARVTIRYEGPVDTVKPNLHILAIGINAYTDKGWTPPGASGPVSFPPLKLAIADAQAFADELQNAAEGLYGEVRITQAFDAGATAAGLQGIIERISAGINPRDTFVLYAAAHGISESGRYYLIPQDYQGGSDPQALKSRAIGQDHLQDWIANLVKAKKALILLDTCESGALVAGYTKSRAEAPASEAAVGRLHEATGRPVLTAAATGKPAFEGYKGHGVFTYALMEALHKGDTNNNGKIELTELVAHVEKRVPELSAELDEKGGVVKGIAAAPTRGASGDKQSAHFGSTGEDFAIAQRLLP